jgi:glycosyltransferase involved in cell wall biosynthesis
MNFPEKNNALQPIKISVIIATHNRLSMLKKCLKAIERQTLPPDRFEVIVVSDGSTDGTNRFLEELKNLTRLNFRYFITPNKGPATARNAGIKEARADLIVFTDDDCIAHTNWLADYLENAPTDLFCAGIGGEVENIDPRKHKAFFNVIRSNRHPIPDKNGHVPYLITANALYQKRALLDVGGFDEQFPLPGGEDPDLSQRLIERGYYLKLLDGALVEHHDRISFRGIFKTLTNYGAGSKIRAALKSTPKQSKSFNILLAEYQAIRSRYLFRNDIGKLIKWYWQFLQIAYHLGERKGHQQQMDGLRFPAKGSLEIISNPEMPPNISVIVPCYNDGKYLADAIESVEQFPDRRIYEIIVIDDGSDDGNTKNVLDAIAKKGHTVLKPGKVGKCKVRNLGIAKARGKFILTLDADNKIEWDYIRKGIYVMNQSAEVGVVFGNRQHFGDENDYHRVFGFNIRQMFISNYIDTCAIFRKEAWKDAGGFDEQMPLQHREDWNFWLAVYSKGWKFYHLDELMFHYRVRKDAEGKKGDLPEVSRIIERYVTEKYADIFRKEFAEMHNELEQIHKSKMIVLRDKLKLPLNYIKLIFPGKAKKGDV